MFSDSELQDQLSESLAHLSFARDLLRRTGTLKEFHDLGWAYGNDHNGGFGVQESQLDTLIDMLDFDFNASVDTFEPTDEAKLQWIGFEGDFDAIQALGQDEWMVGIRFDGEKEDICELYHFLQWMPCSLDKTFLKEKEDDSPHLLWIIGEVYENPSELCLAAFSQLLKIWEVQTYYGNVTNTPAWRRSRGENTVNDDTREVA